MAGKIFISYRRGVDSSAAGRLYDRLEMHVGRDRLFMDVDDIPKGVDFVEFLEGQVAQCTHLLAVIGPGWLSAMGRLRDEEDFVRIEIEAALARDGVRVIPVLMDGARMPAREDLPEALQPFRRRNGLIVPHASFAAVIERELLPSLEELPTAPEVAPEAEPKSSRRIELPPAIPFKAPLHAERREVSGSLLSEKMVRDRDKKFDQVFLRYITYFAVASSALSMGYFLINYVLYGASALP